MWAIFAVLLVNVSLALDCPPEWSAYAAANKCFKAVYNQTVVGANAFSATCRALQPGGTLASVHSDAEQDFVRGLAAPFGRVSVWIGLTNTDNNFAWRWSDNTTVDYLFWELGQPDHFTDRQHCVRMQLDKQRGPWDDIECDNAAFNMAICQTVVVKAYASDNFTDVPDNSTLTIDNSSIVAVDNATIAIAGNATSALVYNTTTAMLVNASSLFVGNATAVTAVFTLCQNGTSGHGNWNCTSAPSPVNATVPAPCLTTCDDGWTSFDGGCYLYAGGASSYAQAHNACSIQGPGSDLISVHNDRDVGFVASFLPTTDLAQSSASYSVWLGLQFNNYTFSWSDGTRMDYCGRGDYSSGFPAAHGCYWLGVAGNNTGLFENVDCNGPTAATVLCKKPAKRT